jgi:hypothetical protein
MLDLNDGILWRRLLQQSEVAAEKDRAAWN